ncbi:MAG: hypothetical protein AAGF12_38550 [Myxococcota bacterium]
MAVCAIVAGVLTPNVLAPSQAEAQEVQVTGPLAGAPACRNCRIYREGRFQLQPFIGFTLQDEFTRTIPLGLQINYHFTDWLGIGLWGAWSGINLDTGLTSEVESQGETTTRNRLSLPNRQGFPEQIGQIDFMAALQLTFIPLRGKLALFQKAFIDADFYVFAGFAIAGVTERAEVSTEGDFNPGLCDNLNPNPAVPDICDQSQVADESRIALAPTFGVGLMLMVNEFFGISFEWRGLPFSWNTSGTDEAGPDGEFPDGLINSDDRIFHFNHMVNIGFAFYLPVAARVSE